MKITTAVCALIFCIIAQHYVEPSAAKSFLYSGVFFMLGFIFSLLFSSGASKRVRFQNKKPYIQIIEKVNNESN